MKLPNFLRLFKITALACFVLGFCLSTSPWSSVGFLFCALICFSSIILATAQQQRKEAIALQQKMTPIKSLPEKKQELENSKIFSFRTPIVPLKSSASQPTVQPNEEPTYWLRSRKA